MDFDLEKDLELIRMVKQMPQLYDPNHKHFKNSEEKFLSWELISTKVGRSGNSCQTRWNSLRRSFRKKRAKGLDHPELMKWRYTKELEFIYEPKVTSGTEPKPDEEAENQDAPASKEIHEIIEKKDNPKAVSEIFGKIDYQRGLMLEKLREIDRARTPVKRFFDLMAGIVEDFPSREQMEVRRKVCKLVSDMEISLEQNNMKK